MKLDNRLWLLVSVVLSVGVLAGAWFLGAAPLVDSAGRSAAQQATIDQQNDVTRSKIASLKKSQEELPKLRDQLTSLHEAVPESVDGSAFIEQVNAIASATGVTVKSITLTAPSAYAPAVPDATGTPGGASTPSSSPSPSASPSATASAAPVPTGPTAPSAPTDPLITSTNFVLVKADVAVVGSGDQVLQFLHGLQYGKRLILVTALTSTTGEAGAVDLSVGGSIYVLKSTTTTPAAGSTATGS